MDERQRLMYEFEAALQGVEGYGHDDLRLKLVSMYRDAIEERDEYECSGNVYINANILTSIEEDASCIEGLVVRMASQLSGKLDDTALSILQDIADCAENIRKNAR